MSDRLPPKLFAETIPQQMQMQNLTKLRTENPEKAREIFMMGQQLIEYSANGELRALKKAVYSINDELGIFPYFGSKMFKESLVHGHLLVSLFIIENGYPFKNKSYPSAMHEVLETESFPDYLGEGVVGFLSTQGCDVNRQIGGTWLTPLHIAVRRNLVRTVATLISLGADVNAVGKNDVMPLNIAQERTCDIEESEDAAFITKMLEENGAKASVKELLRGGSGGGSTTTADNSTGSGFSFSTSGGMPFTTNSMVSVSSGATSDRPAGGSVVYGDSLQSEPKKTVVQASSTAAPVMASASGGGGSNNNFVRFTGGAGGPTPVVVSGGPVFTTSFSSSTQELNKTAIPMGDPAPAVNVISSGAGGDTLDQDGEKAPDSNAYSKASDDGGMMFSTS